ncbi:MAG: UDP-glucose/GDP-mannose dehydrogenase family protein [candidate division KSB1 bacterium]|nr:UDP-glucose/GDP-mannose dehydrogenase family protein [candidate division KSB1 bacterium]MDZ7276007.1 UDP-glucose/GDP-mannose dehydrogenase family protein [candidate division KSB1 bacterium]MDZ7285711.1 UDP-glucose/GDP-mannose dehydrogenase family protein [candidate division KSB1 bacterium]MDZ7298743.1 UDP-glucose/GDP-mannose dehydrogenase family protein [candidate division KSB1 bacterium]MDZ7349608.1 UDP-glucose/GDP-mannose dehydrogenase family protein [candidate division KSB1 bacterium]
MHICMIGTGYVGLVTGTCFAEFGNEVVCVDNDQAKIARLQAGEMPIYEPGLETLVAQNVRAGRLSFTTDLKRAVENALVIFIAVGTPAAEDGSADLRYVETVARDIARYMNGYKVIVNKSTVPVGAGKWIKKVIQEHQPAPIHFSVVSNPEFLREGSAIEDFMRPNRVVIGAEDSEAMAIMKDLYSPLYLIETPIVMTNLASAELTKYAANAFLATKVSFINEVATICERVGADVHDVAKGMGLDNRIGTKFLHAGPGYGGSCFPKDTRALLAIAQQHDYRFQIVEAAVRVNEQQRRFMVQKIKQATGGVKGKTIAVLGLSFKPNTDDMREAPAVDIIRALLAEGAVVRAYDPVAVPEARKLLPQVTYGRDAYEIMEGADALVFITEWNQFRSLDLNKVKTLLRTPLVIDLRNIYEPHKMADKGIKYFCVGR